MFIKLGTTLESWFIWVLSHYKIKTYFLETVFRCRNATLTPTPSARRKMLADKRVDIWEMGVSVYHILPRSGPGPAPGSPLKSDAWNWTITSAGGCWLGTCSPALLLRPASEDKTNIFWWGRDNCGTLACGIPQKVWRKVLVMSQKCRMNTQHMILKWKRCIVYRQAEDKLPCSYLSAIS